MEIISTPVSKRLGDEHVIAKLVDHGGSAAALGTIIFFVLLVRTDKDVVKIVNGKVAENFNDDWTYGKKYSFINFWYDFFLHTPVDFYNYIKLSFYFAVLVPVGCALLLLLLNGDVGALNLLGTVFNLLSILIAIDGKRITNSVKSVIESQYQSTSEPVV